jgi:hypothetical protein
MAGIDADIWVCGECRSINNLRAKQCYRCRTPRDVAAVDPAQVEGTGHGKLREIALPEFHSSRGAAFLASACLVLLPVIQIVSTVADAILFGRIVRDPSLLDDPAFGRSIESLVAGTSAIAALAIALLALTAWAFWLRGAVMAMPALGLGYPPASGTMAFAENFLPGLNLFRVPAIVRDVIRRLDPESLRSEALIFAAWIGLLGGYLVPRLMGYLELFGPATLEEAVRRTLIVQSIATALVVVGATFLVALIWWIERRIARRRAAQLEGEPEGAAAVAGAAVAAAAQSTAPSMTIGPDDAASIDEDRPLAATPGDAALESSGERPPAPLPALGTLAVAAARDGMAPPSAPEPPVEDAAPVGIEPPVDSAPSVDSGPAEAAEAPTPAAEAPADQMRNRPITAVTGAASIAGRTREDSLPDVRPDDADARPLVAADAAVEVEPSPAAPEPPIESAPAAVQDDSPGEPEPPVEPVAAATEEPASEPEPGPEPPAQAGTGPQLHLRVESASSMIATIDGESEPITLDELRAAAEALARAHGSAVIATVGTSFGALSLAEQAFEVLTDAQVGTTVEE